MFLLVLPTQTCRTKRSLERVPGCRGVGAVLADGVACLHSAQAEPRLGSGCPCCAGCIGFHGRNHASWGLEGSPCWHRLVHQAFDLLHLPAVRPSLLGVPPLQLPLGLGLLRGTGHGHQPDPAWDAARWGSPCGIDVANWQAVRFSNLQRPQQRGRNMLFFLACSRWSQPPLYRTSRLRGDLLARGNHLPIGMPIQVAVSKSPLILR